MSSRRVKSPSPRRVKSPSSRRVKSPYPRRVKSPLLRFSSNTRNSYTKPELRERIKNRIMAGTKGGKAGQWSARKAQLLAHEYEKAGGGYTGPRTSAQKSLSRWSGQKWRTSDRKPAIRAGGTTRYLPDAAWRRLSPVQIADTNRAKLSGSKRGIQFVPNTSATKVAGRIARRTSKK